MLTDSFEENNRNNIFGRNEVFIPSQSIVSQNNSESDLDLQLYFFDKNVEIDKSIFEYLKDNDTFRNINLNKIPDDNMKFKISLKEEIPILYSFDDIEKKYSKKLFIKKNFHPKLIKNLLKMNN